MKKLAYLFAGMAAFGLCSCSSDEPSNPEGNIAKGDVAYLNVNIVAAGNASRATSGDFEYGSGDENAVKTAHFYFYDEQGNFVTESNTWAGVKNNDGSNTNVEVFGKNTVVLEGLTGKNYPNWVVTVLNKPDGTDMKKRTIKEMGEQLTNWSTTDKDGKFVMSTTSYKGENNSPYYYATKLVTENFSTQPSEGFAEERGTTVDIYVERLAARVHVGITMTPTVIGEVKSYKVPVTIAGAANGDSGSTNGDAPIAAENVYIQVLGWDLISTAKNSTLSKQLDGLADWTTSWNDAANFRSYWGKSTTYGLAGDNLKGKLIESKSYNDLTLDLDTVQYCNETTNEIANIVNEKIANPSKTPSVLLKAKIVDAHGNALDLVNFLGINFTKDGFLCKVLDLINKTDIEGVCYKDGEQYKPFDETCVDYYKATYSGASFAAVEVKIKDGVSLYNQVGEPLNTDKISSINTKLSSVTSSRNEAFGYKTGMTYYAIPLEHINTPAAGSTDPVEGQYGVVRNHIYKLNITKITSIGDAVFDPNDKIEPDPKEPNYYVESQINILSWKVVSQEAEI